MFSYAFHLEECLKKWVLIIILQKESKQSLSEQLRMHFYQIYYMGKDKSCVLVKALKLCLKASFFFFFYNEGCFSNSLNVLKSKLGLFPVKVGFLLRLFIYHVVIFRAQSYRAHKRKPYEHKNIRKPFIFSSLHPTNLFCIGV